MSVAIANQGSQYVVELNHGGKAVQIPCKDKADAKEKAKEAKLVETELVKQEKKLGVSPEQYMAAMEQQAAATKPAGVGEKLDVKTA